MGMNWGRESKPYTESLKKKKNLPFKRLKTTAIHKFQTGEINKFYVENITYATSCVHNSVMCACVKIRKIVVIISATI